MDRKTHPEYDPSLDDPERRRDEGARLVDDGIVDEEKDLVADAEGEDLGEQTAEEAAVRVQESPPPGATEGPDSYVEDHQDG